MSLVELRATRCAICGISRNARELYAANFTDEAFNAAIFSARRLPDGVHYRLVKCAECGLVRSDPVADPALFARLYRDSAFSYGAEADNLEATYGRYLKKLERYGVRKSALLEIGCGNGFFLEEALRQGYESVAGVEPSAQAIAQADEKIRPRLIADVMRAGLFDAGQFDVICAFQVFDHLPDPAGVLEECRRVLKPEGMVLCINHNVESFSARLLKERSPIIDIEHTYLFSPATMARLFAAHGFAPLDQGAVWNTYTLSYLTRLLPMPPSLKAAALKTLQKTRLGKIRLSIALGNLYLIARNERS
ncbi:MAG: class I SAM-dependent methyltransferase [Candidatus Sumerlaeota bacterium]|nr:class I SAM-dependent methyltransferase [Candidatus Sumerlaeota bacterium]